MHGSNPLMYCREEKTVTSQKPNELIYIYKLQRKIKLSQPVIVKSHVTFYIGFGTQKEQNGTK